jgi:hypothetical protein
MTSCWLIYFCIFVFIGRYNPLMLNSFLKIRTCQIIFKSTVCINELSVNMIILCTSIEHEGEL